MKFDIYRRQNKEKLLLQANSTFNNSLYSGLSEIEINSNCTRLHKNAKERMGSKIQEGFIQKEEKVFRPSSEPRNYEQSSRLNSRSLTPQRKIGKKEANDIYKRFIEQ